MQLRALIVAGTLLFACTTSPGIVATSSTDGAGPRFHPPPPADEPSSGPLPPQGEAEAACPSDAPKDGTFCDAPSTVCYYGPDLRDVCRDQFECMGTHTWLKTTPDCANDCPASRDAIQNFTTCPDSRVACTYDEGTCACIDDGLDPGDAGADDGGDGSVPARPGNWRCAPAPKQLGCPKTPPRGYQICVKPVTCDYGACELRLPLIWTCDGSSWERTASPCDP